MPDIAIAVSGVSKKFRLFDSTRKRFLEAVHPFGRTYHREFWALKDISFQVPRGTTVGIVGRNGSGKSTLLQIICSVLQPTAGTLKVDGRISALLELGADFNPELSGRDNVIWKGVRMGFTPGEMRERLSVIEEFADIGEFIDHPIRVYSSGMFIRLAFATAINVDPDILIVDEALAVGDAKFQHKCYCKFREFQNAGKTIVLVTHSTDAVSKYCDSVILLDYGRIIKMGTPQQVLNLYIDILMGGVANPRLVKSVHGYNIVALHGAYYALPLCLGKIDIAQTNPGALPGVLAAQTIQQLELLLERDGIKSDQAKCATTHESGSELQTFLNQIPKGDNCVNRRSYNKNAYRQGDERGNIIDYLIEVDGEYDAITIDPGSDIHIYFKVKFECSIDKPIAGFAIRTIDGLKIFGTNTFILGISLPSVECGETRIYHFHFKAPLFPNDYFLDIGVSENDGTRGGRILQVRRSLAHLVFTSERGAPFDGLVNLAPFFDSDVNT